MSDVTLLRTYGLREVADRIEQTTAQLTAASTRERALREVISKVNTQVENVWPEDDWRLLEIKRIVGQALANETEEIK